MGSNPRRSDSPRFGGEKEKGKNDHVALQKKNREKRKIRGRPSPKKRPGEKLVAIRSRREKPKRKGLGKISGYRGRKKKENGAG